jgi:hypothetical protein
MILVGAVLTSLRPHQIGTHDRLNAGDLHKGLSRLC